MIQVLICTIDHRIQNVIHTISTQHPGVCYLVSWQQTTPNELLPPPSLTQRADVRILTTRGKGISANRNNAISHATEDILVIADDDCTYTAEYFDTIRTAYSAMPEADIIAFQAVDPEGKPYKADYPAHSYRYEHRPYGSYINSCEITFRRNKRLPHFDERFGLGSEVLKCGEEEIFLHEAARQGFHIHYVPQVIVSTPSNTTGTRFAVDQGVRMSKGAVLKYIHGYWGASLRCIKFALLYTKFNPISFVKIFKDLYQGILYIK